MKKYICDLCKKEITPADTPSLFKCSVCGWECNDTYTCDSEFKYCPNCGIELEE